MYKLYRLAIVCMVLFCIFATPAFADTNFTCTIRSSGGDFTNLSTWETAIEGDLVATASKVFTVSDANTYVRYTDDNTNVTFSGGGTGFLKYINVSNQAYIVNCSGSINAGEVTIAGGHKFTISDTGTHIGLAIAECYNDWPSGLNDNCTIRGWITGSNNYVVIQTPLSERHTGVPGTGFFLTPIAGWYTGIYLEEIYTQAIGIEVNSPLNYKNKGFWLKSSDCVVEKCIAVGGGVGFFLGSGTAGTIYKISNCLAIDVVSGDKPYGFATAITTSRSANYVYNCTAINCGKSGTGDPNGGFYHSNSTTKTYYKNCLAYDCANGGFVTHTNVNISFCASSDDTADDSGGLGNRTNQTFTFVDASADNYHLVGGTLSKGDQGARAHGTNLANDVFYPIDNDIDGEIRFDPWDIGFDQSPPAPPAGLVIILK